MEVRGNKEAFDAGDFLLEGETGVGFVLEVEVEVDQDSSHLVHGLLLLVVLVLVLPENAVELPRLFSHQLPVLLFHSLPPVFHAAGLLG